jgi:hypothetical protein
MDLSPPRAYAEVAIRRAWSDLLLKLGLREKAAEAYDEALVRAAVLSRNFDWQPVERPTGFACEHMSVTGSGLRSVGHGKCAMRPVFADQTNRAS